jgi:hypothetical protein
MSKPRVSHTELLEILDYNSDSGTFIWKISPKRGMPSGSVAGSNRWDGYVAIFINRRSYYAHVLAWFYVHGEWPSGELDHINQVKSDNRIANLRVVTKSQNCQNRPIRIDNKSGHVGVYWYAAANKWRAQISVNGIKKYLGSFVKKQEAINAYVSARNIYHAGYVGE